jgi:hypothetical protein
MDKSVRVWQIGPDGTEYYSAHSEEEMKKYYRSLGTDTCEEDLRDHFEEVTDLDAEFEFDDDGERSRTTWRKLAESMPIPTQISTGYN